MTKTRLEWWYWLAIGVVIGIGMRGLWIDYLQGQAPFIALSDWRLGANWLDMIELIIQQFTVFGAGLSLLGLARLARWYAPLGTVSMVGFAAYWLFGVVYSGANEAILLLPMFVIFVLWMTYAVLAISEWGAKSLPDRPIVGRYIIISTYAILPAWLLWQIVV